MTRDTQSAFERHFITRFATIMALVTGLLYLRTIIAGGLLLSGADAWEDTGSALGLLVAIAVVGLVAAWYWEIIGGGICLIAGLCISVMLLFWSQQRSLWAAFAYSSPFIISGALLIYDWWGSDRNSKPA